VLLATFLLTVFEDLTLGIAVGVTLGAFLFLHRMAEAVEATNGGGMLVEDEADDYGGKRVAYDAASASEADFMVYKISGAFFFGAASSVGAVLDGIGKYPRAFVFDFNEVPLIDITAAKVLEAFVHKLRRMDTQVYIAGARPGVRRALLSAGLRKPEVFFTQVRLPTRGSVCAQPPVRMSRRCPTKAPLPNFRLTKRGKRGEFQLK
jgi:SulP family sulfate permease